MFSASARADSGAVVESSQIGRSALPAVDHVLSAKPGEAFVLAAGSAGYGLTESQAGEGAHHRLAASVAAALRPLPELTVSLSFAGRYDAHPDGDNGAVGLPTLTVLGSRSVTSRLYVGAALALALPGHKAPSLDFGASVLTAAALATLRASHGWLLSAQLGFRLDNSAHAAPDVARLSRADRLALGLSDFNALPLGAAATKSLGAVQLSAELSGEILIGHAAPTFLRSPLRAAAVARVRVAKDLSVEVFSRLGLSRRPNYARVYPLIPVEPRLTLGVGLRFAASASRSSATPERTELYGTVVDSEGAGLTRARVVLRTHDLVLAALSEPDGSFRFYNLPRGLARLQVSAAESEPLEYDLLLDRSEQTISLRVMRRTHGSQLRGLVRSFEGVPLQANVRVLPEGTSVSADKDGRFVLELAPGRYQVEIECRGYRTQRRKVTVQQNGVTLLNVELRAVRR